MFRWYGNIGGAGSVGLLVLRLAAGAAFILHGWAKIQSPNGWMGWMNMPDHPSPVPPYMQAAAAVAEFGGGIAWIIGFLTPLFSLAIACTMATAYALVHFPMHHGFVVANWPGQPFVPSFELTAVYFGVAVCLLLVGPGRLSLDYALFSRRPTSNLPPYALDKVIGHDHLDPSPGPRNRPPGDRGIRPPQHCVNGKRRPRRCRGTDAAEPEAASRRDLLRQGKQRRRRICDRAASGHTWLAGTACAALPRQRNSPAMQP